MKSEFDRDLESYVISTSVQKALADAGKIPWLRYTAAAGSALAMASAADAAIVYSGLQNITVLNTGAAGVDLDFDSVDEFAMRQDSQWWTFPSYWGTSNSAYVDGLANPAKFLLNGAGGLQKLSFGATISAGAGSFGTSGIVLRSGSGGGWSWSTWATSWWSSAPAAPAVAAAGSWANSVTGLAGFAFDIGGSEHFGWIRFHVDGYPYGTRTFTAIDWAYEDVAGAAIKAGATAVPEPAGLGLALLGGGAAGLAAWRRRRQAVQPDRADA